VKLASTTIAAYRNSFGRSSSRSEAHAFVTGAREKVAGCFSFDGYLVFKTKD
jgi:hypothetical protein